MCILAHSVGMREEKVGIMRYADKFFDEIYYFPNKYNDEIHFVNLHAAIKYKFEDGVDDGFYFGKTQDKVLEDFKIILRYLVDELKDFYIEYWDGKNALDFYNVDEFLEFIKNNNIDIFDDVVSLWQLNLYRNKEKLELPQNIPEYIHQIFEPYLFCELNSK